jgi:DNA-binding NarL/FixJ family response regulator
MKQNPLVAKAEKKKQILIVEDHPLIRFGLATLLNRHGDYQVCGEAMDHQEALVKIRELNPDLVTVDLTLKNSHGLELIKDIRVQFPALLILVVSIHDEFLNARRLISAGAHGYLTKLEPLTQVLTAVERIFAGEVYVSHQVTSQMALQLAGHHRNQPTPEIHNLSDRELQIFELTGDGLGVRQIAFRLKLGPSTVETYCARIKEKLCLNGHSELLQSAIRWNHSGNLPMKPEEENVDDLKAGSFARGHSA